MLENKWLIRKHQLNKSSKAFVWFLLEVTSTQAIWSVFNTSVNHRYIILEDMLKGKSLQKRKYLKITLQHLAHTCRSTFYSDNFRTPWAVFGFCIFLFQTISATKLIWLFWTFLVHNTYLKQQLGGLANYTGFLSVSCVWTCPSLCCYDAQKVGIFTRFCL